MPALASARRVAWVAAGLVAVALGGIGIVVPGLPTTVFFIVAAWCFSRSSERLERWVLGLPRIGPMVADHRNGLGMPRRAKVIAIGMVVVFASLSALLGLDHVAARLAVITAACVGVYWIAVRVPTRERVLAVRG
jgi:uncharacterized membrane protein YbaN (DUF454 family)